jgi:DNA-binding response OmpR family regulator
MHVDRPPVLHPPKGTSAPPPERPAPVVFAQPLAVLPRLAGARVLVVEDDKDSRELLCVLLELAGATVLGAESVAEAMEGIHHSFDPDVVLTDYSMPIADGFDLIREFRRVPSTRAVAVPILVLSGHTEDHWRARVLEAGAADLLIKPVDPTFLITRIAAAVASVGGAPH